MSFLILAVVKIFTSELTWIMPGKYPSCLNSEFRLRKVEVLRNETQGLVYGKLKGLKSMKTG